MHADGVVMMSEQAIETTSGPLGQKCRRSLAVLVGAFAAGGVFAGLLNMAPSSSAAWGSTLTYALLFGVLGVAVYRRNKILELQRDLVRQQAQEIQLTHAALNNHALVCLTDPDGKIASVNENFTAKFGYRQEDLIGRHISIIYPDGDEDATMLEVRRSLARGEIWTGESEEITAEGAKVFMRCTIVPMLDEAGNLVKTVSIRTDNTEYRRAEKARFLKSLFDHLQDEVYIFRTDSLQMVYANHRALEASNWSAKDIDAKTIIDADSQMNAAAFRAHVAPLMRGDRDSVSIEVMRGDRAGEIRTRVVRSDDGELLFVSVLRDTTERMETERARLESVSVVSHELRTPLTSIRGALRLLGSGAVGDFDAQAKSVLDIAERNTETLLLIVNDILDLEKIRAGKMRLEKSDVDLVSFLNDVVEMNTGYGAEFQVDFDFSTRLDTAMARLAPERMMQVFANLLSNAAKYSPTNDTVRVGLEDDGEYWQVSVTDRGPGIPESARETVFESFGQVQNTDGKTRKGTGLGMAIARKIVLAHGGEIDFESEPGHGTTFYVRLRKPHLEADLGQGDTETASLSDVA